MVHIVVLLKGKLVVKINVSPSASIDLYQSDTEEIHMNNGKKGMLINAILIILLVGLGWVVIITKMSWADRIFVFWALSMVLVILMALLSEKFFNMDELKEEGFADKKDNFNP